MRKLTCKSCGAKLEIKEEVNRIECSYCGNEWIIDSNESKEVKEDTGKTNQRKEGFPTSLSIGVIICLIIGIFIFIQYLISIKKETNQLEQEALTNEEKLVDDYRKTERDSELMQKTIDLAKEEGISLVEAMERLGTHDLFSTYPKLKRVDKLIKEIEELQEELKRDPSLEYSTSFQRKKERLIREYKEVMRDNP